MSVSAIPVSVSSHVATPVRTHAWTPAAQGNESGMAAVITAVVRLVRPPMATLPCLLRRSTEIVTHNETGRESAKESEIGNASFTRTLATRLRVPATLIPANRHMASNSSNKRSANPVLLPPLLLLSPVHNSLTSLVITRIPRPTPISTLLPLSPPPSPSPTSRHPLPAWSARTPCLML